MTVESIELLLVEDSPTDRELTMLALRSHEALDFLFGTGESGGRGTHHLPKVILLDLKLPKIDGIEVLKQIRANPHTATMPVVVLTSSSEERDILDTYNLGVNSYIVKPVDFEQFSEVVRQLGFYWLLINQPPLR